MQALRNVGRKLKAGTGKVLFRDYAEGDLAQVQLKLVHSMARFPHP